MSRKGLARTEARRDRDQRPRPLKGTSSFISSFVLLSSVLCLALLLFTITYLFTLTGGWPAEHLGEGVQQQVGRDGTGPTRTVDTGRTVHEIILIAVFILPFSIFFISSEDKKKVRLVSFCCFVYMMSSSLLLCNYSSFLVGMERWDERQRRDGRDET